MNVEERNLTKTFSIEKNRNINKEKNRNEQNRLQTAQRGFRMCRWELKQIEQKINEKRKKKTDRGTDRNKI